MEKDENLQEIEAEVVENQQADLAGEESKEQVIDEAQEEVVRLKETIARLQADFTNYKNRTEKEKSAIYKYAAEGVITKLLPVIDNFERAMLTADGEDSFAQGMDLIRVELEKILEAEGLEEIKSDGEVFDPNLHHAVFVEESDEIDSEHIIETFQKGYKLKDKIIRPAMVKVAK